MITRRTSRRLDTVANKTEKCPTNIESSAIVSSPIKKTNKRRQSKSNPNEPKTKQPPHKTLPAPPKAKGRKSAKRKADELDLDTNLPLDKANDKLHEQPSSKKARYVSLNFKSFVTEPVIEHLRSATSDSDKTSHHVDINHEIIDQIALEGLAGITLSKLLQFLDAICPSLRCAEDERAANFVLSILSKRYLNQAFGNNIEVFYVDPNSVGSVDWRPGVGVGGGRKKSELVVDKPIPLPQQTLKRFINFDLSLYPVQDGLIMGSCKNYASRLNITEDVRKLLDEDASLRSMKELDAKYGLNNIFFVASQTSRTKALMPNWADPNIDIKLREYCALELIGKSRTLGIIFPHDKTLGRYRIMLMAKGFITQYQQTSSSPIEHHLTRFTQTRLALKQDKLTGKSGSGKEVTFNDEKNEASSDRPSSSYCCAPSRLKADRSILSMVYDVIAESNGLIALEARKKLRLPKFHLRNHLKNLVSIEMIHSTTSKSDPDKAGFRIFKTAHKSAKRKKLKNELAKPTGIMASWDEPDLRAKKIIGHKRSSFSKAEDSLLILCRITSILIDASLKLSWCVHKRLVRDLLHKELLESHDKTSDACLRRIKYLKRLPNNIMSINELTAELRDDPDIKRLVPEKSHGGNDERLNKVFIQVLKCVRAKIPNLLGISSASYSASSSFCTSAPARTASGRKIANQLQSRIMKARDGGPAQPSGPSTSASSSHSYLEDDVRVKDDYIEIADHGDLRERYELIDCQSVASITRAPTYEKPRNVVDVRFNNACLVTMAFYLTSCYQSKEELARRRDFHWLLDKFYSNYHDKLISSMLSKLNKRSLLTRKCAADELGLYKPRSRMSLKLNQSVLFLLNRHQSHSLMQLAHTISPIYRINLSENNEMASIALLTSLCSSSSFNLDMELKIPPNVVGIDQGNENFRSLLKRASEGTREILSRFMSRCGKSLALATTTTTTTTAAAATKLEPPSPKRLEENLGGPSTSSSFHSSSTSATTGVSIGADGQQPMAKECTNATAAAAADDDDSLVVRREKSDNDNNNSASSTPIREITAQAASTKMDDSRRALFLLRHELKAHALDKCGSLADCLIVQPCNISFSSPKQGAELKKGPLDKFLNQAKPLDVMDADKLHHHQQHAATGAGAAQWLVKSFRLPTREEAEEDDRAGGIERDLEAIKIPVEYQARVWKTIDGQVHRPTLFKLIESLLAWIIVHPGVERDTLQLEFGHLMPQEHLLELLDLMESLELINGLQVVVPLRRARLFGYNMLAGGESRPLVAYEASSSAYVTYCQLLNDCK